MARFDGLMWHRAFPPLSVNPKRQIVPDPAGEVAYTIGSSVYLFRNSSWQTLALPLPSIAFATELGPYRSLAVTEGRPRLAAGPRGHDPAGGRPGLRMG